MAEEAFKAINAHDPERYAKMVDDAYVLETSSSPGPIRGREEVKQFMGVYFKAFPDFHYEVEQMIVGGDYVIARWQITGTHKGEFNGILPTNRQVKTRGCTITEFRNGRIAKTMLYFDQLVLLQQLGVTVGKAAGAAS